MKWDKRMAQYSSGKRIVVADLSASCDYPHLHFARQRVSRQQAGDLQRSPRLPMPFYLRKTRSFFATQVTRLIKYQMVLVGKSPTSRRNSCPVSTRAFDSRVLSIIWGGLPHFFLNTSFLTSGQNSMNALLPIFPSTPYRQRRAAWPASASLSARHVLERKLFPTFPAKRAYAG